MIEIQNYNESALKDELKETRLLKTVKPSVIDRKYVNQYDARIRAHEKNNRLKRLYSPKTLPVRVANIVIDFKLYQLFLSKIKAYETEISISENTLVIKYWKFGTVNKGRLVLNDLSEFYKGFQHIPKAKLSGQLIEMKGRKVIV